MPLIQYAQVEAGIEDALTRITEASDTRITESGDIRVTNEVKRNAVEGFLSATAIVLTFYQDMYYNVNGAWKISVPYIKNNDNWVQPQAIYVKRSGNWERAF